MSVAATVDGVPYTPGSTYSVEGWHQLVVTGTDNQGSVTVERAFGIDTQPPVFDGLSPASGSLLDASSITITGRVSADTETLSVAGLAATMADPVGEWRDFSSPPITLTEGLQTVVLVATDQFGHSATLDLTYDLDTLAPAVDLDTPADGTVLPESPATVGGAIAEAHLSSLLVNGVSATLSGDRFTAVVNLVEGPNTITAVATDALGRSASDTLTLVLDTTAPNVTVDTPADGSVVDAEQIDVEGDVSDPYLAGVTVNGITGVVTGDRYVAAGVPLIEGPNAVSATAVDTVGNSYTSPAISVVRDTLPPDLTVNTGSIPTLTAAASLTLTGTASDPHLETVTVGGATATVSGGTWSAEVPLSEGENTFVVRAEDTLGHFTESDPIVVERDSLPPQIVITEPADQAGFDTTGITVRGTVVDPHLDPASVHVNGVVATVPGDGTFEVLLTLPEGDSTLVASAEDTLGHLGSSAPVSITIDTLPPVVTLTEPLEPYVSTATVTLLGTIHEPHLSSLTVQGINALVDETSFRSRMCRWLKAPTS